MINKIQNAGTEVVEAKAGAGSATLSMVGSQACYSRHALIRKINEQRFLPFALLPSRVGWILNVG